MERYGTTNYETIEVEQEGGVGIVRWNRPSRLNAFNGTMYDEWIQAYDAFNADPAIGAVVCTGTGRAYSSGADIGDFESTFTDAPVVRQERPHEPFDPWYMAEGKPTIAAVNGLAVGIGFTSLLWYDIVLASTEAKFSARFAAIGLTPELSSSWVLPKLIGVQRAKEMLLTGRIYDASEALTFGLIREILDPEELLPKAIALAGEIAANPRSTVRKIKRMVMDDMLTGDLSVVDRRSKELFSAARKTVEHREALLALRERRPARYHDAAYMKELESTLPE